MHQDPYPVHQIRSQEITTNPIFAIGEIEIPGDNAMGAVVVTATMSRTNSMSKLGGWHIALSTALELTWKEGEEYDIFAPDLSGVFIRNKPSVLRALFPDMTAAEVGSLECAFGENTEGTATRGDLHSHVFVAKAATWKAELVRRMVDDARRPRAIATEVLERAGVTGEAQLDILNELYPPSAPEKR